MMKTIQMQKTFYKVGDFISWQRSGTLELSPDFQRRSVWSTGTKSFLIDTIVRGFPIPIIFLRDKLTDLTSFEPSREVIDGQQRLRTVIAFIAPDLLPDFDSKRDNFQVMKTHNTELSGKSFGEMPADIQRQILDYRFSVHVLSSGVDDRTVLQIFQRMNSTSYRLNAQELRNARWFGEFKTSAYNLAAEHLDYWRQWGVFSENDISRMKEVESTSDFILFMLEGVRAGTKRVLDKVYEEKDHSYPNREVFEDRFRSVMNNIDDKLGLEMRHLIFSRQALIYTLYAWFYTKMYGEDMALPRSVSPNSISPEEISELKLLGERAEKDESLESYLRRPRDVKSRTQLLQYFGVQVRSENAEPIK